ncbi:MAG: cob(I)yrinic acid a,c-diamide adenosyltransferase [Burkholderiaceae bacterium]
MKTRISKVVTKTGDNGTTSLADSTRISKNHKLIHVLGEIDELNSSLGLLIYELKTSKFSKLNKITESLTLIQHELFNLGGEISMPNAILITGKEVSRITKEINDLNQDLPPLKEFILPGGSKLASLAHISRTIARRAERNLVGLIEANYLKTVNIEKNGLPYLNRLSDLLFVIARYFIDVDKNENILWKNPKNTDRNFK